MREYEISVLDQYHIEVSSTRKIRGAVLCDTKQGWLLLKEAALSEKRVPVLYQLYEHLEKNGYTRVDQFVKNTEGNICSTAQDGTKYILKRWFYGRECDVRKEYEVIETSKNLALLHQIMKGILEIDDFSLLNQSNEYLRHNRELKKVRSFIRAKVGKGEFESAFLECFDPMFEMAQSVYDRFEHSHYEVLYKDSVQQKTITHGDYNYHNVLMTSEGMATTNFDHFHMDIQAADLYYYLRKAMEKQHWDEKLGDNIINAYASLKPISDTELEYIALRLAYPEKLWKIANTYYRSNKAWIPVKNLEKLKMAIMQTEEKRQFLKNIFAFHL